VLQRHAVQKFHSNEGLTVVFTDIVNGADVRVIKCRRGLRLTLETGERLWVLG